MAGSRRSRLLLVLGTIALVAAACSSGSGSSGTTTTGAGSSATTLSSPGSSSGTGAAGGGSGSPTITSVVFTGTTMAPTITVNGSGLGSTPPANPTYAPAGTQLCPLPPPSGDQGLDYGTSLYIFDTPRNWAGGRYRPELNELDCVGVIITKFTPTQVVFQFGATYAQYQQAHNYLLAEGDAYQLAVNGATFSGTVHYTSG